MMYVKSLVGIVFGAASIVASAAEGFYQNVDTCANIHEVLKVPLGVIPGKKFDVGVIGKDLVSAHCRG